MSTFKNIMGWTSYCAFDQHFPVIVSQSRWVVNVSQSPK